jgi:ATP-binding cassette subfamily B protein/subfamily B ATP-binding cassette protein MsbA
LLRYARPYLLQWIGVSVIIFASSALAVLQPWPVQVVVDHVLDNQPRPQWLARFGAISPHGLSKAGLLAWAASASFVLYGLASLLEAVVSYSWIRVGQRMVYDLTRDLFSVSQRQSLRFHAKHPVGDSMSRIMTDSWCVFNIVESLLLAPAQAIVTTLAMVLLMLRMNPRLTLASVIVAPVISLGSMALAKRLRRIAKARREIESSMQAHVQQVLSGIHVVQAFGQETREQERFTDFAGKAVRAFRRGVFVTNLSNLYTGLLLAIGTGIVLFIGAHQVIAGALTVGELLIFLAYLNTLQNQVGTLARTYLVLQSRRAEIDRVSEYLFAANEISEAPGAISIPQVRGDVSIEDVTFGYEPDRLVLKDVTLQARAGQTIALVGPTGAGKSTLASLVPRFFDPWEGTVRIDDRDVRSLRVRDVRENVSLVLQEAFLFPISVAQNIAFGKPQASRDEIIRAVTRRSSASAGQRFPAVRNSGCRSRGRC